MYSKILPLAFILSLAIFTDASPIIQERGDGPGNSYVCNPSCQDRKRSLRNMGADAQDVAIAFLETGQSLSATVYPFGDEYPNHKPKTGDAANFGLFKNNWGTIRKYCAEFKGQRQDQWKNGAILNTHDVSSIRCQHEQIKALGVDKFYQAQRGVPGQGADYGKAVDYIKNYLNHGHLTDNTGISFQLHPV